MTSSVYGTILHCEKAMVKNNPARRLYDNELGLGSKCCLAEGYHFEERGGG
jgi:hypothetical protein